MSDFVNTVDAIGDEALTDQIIQRTVTEIKDDILTVEYAEQRDPGKLVYRKRHGICLCTFCAEGYL